MLQVADEEHHHHQIDRDGDAGLLPQVLRTMDENQADENQLTEAGDGQDQGRLAGWNAP